MRYAFLLLFLMSCTFFEKQPIPVTQSFPDATPELMKKCEDLQTIQGEKVSIIDMLKTVVENYKLYYECSNKVDGWHLWYDEQKKIFDSIKD